MPPLRLLRTAKPATGAFKMTKEGYVLLQFAPAAGVRQYDWGRKQVNLCFTRCFGIMHLFVLSD
ncbi:ssDNA-binding transcriptional regulator [Actinidia rufa]|uniref:SsDNA-binding transcriptional regulator n=1 Tax=Actinidia rufa TaxID=165716 RepID=A0A7J0ES88_9ERIC|nr:ssDNA-binding transcriptional regulator [Actinidia rufa]